MTTLYPDIEPYTHGLLDVGDGHQIYWECCGNPQGKPAVVLHGGPGSGCSLRMRRYFDPNAYRIVLFDQRNCGRSTPHAGDTGTDLATNTTAHLLADIEQLRQQLGIEQWLVLGSSWGSTLGLAYAERHPERVTELILVGVTMTRRSEIDWLYHGVAPLFPAQWERFRAGAPAAERDGDLVEAYYHLLNHPDPTVCAKAAEEWCAWEDSLLSVDPDYKPERMEAAREMAFARIVTHYFRHNAWLEEGLLLRNAHKLAGIPGVMVQGRLDLGGPLVTAWELAQAWPAGELVLVQGAGHTSRDPGMTEAIIAATDRLATRQLDALFQFQNQPVDQIATLNAAMAALSAPIDSFLEDHILASEFNAILSAETGEQIGHIAIHDGSRLTQFYLQPWARRWSQPIYRAVLQRLSITEALVPTCDEFFLSHALDHYTELHKQAYFFVAGASLEPWNDRAGLNFRQAMPDEVEAIAALNQDFIDDLERRVAHGEIYVGELEGVLVALGVIEQGRLLIDCASIGMMVAPAYRQRGIGIRMIRYLRSVCEAQGIRPLAGCGYGNTLSKRTLEAAGMVTATRLLRITYGGR
ncbi:MAG: prolyl aminopeptidase [Caldilineaceae bacterium]